MKGRNTHTRTRDLPPGDIVVLSRSTVGNYYGEADLCQIGDAYFLALDDHSGIDVRQVSETFAKAWLREFGRAA